MKDTVRGNVIELDELLPFADGTRVEVTVASEEKPLRRGSPEAVLRLLAGTLTHEEAEAIRKVVAEVRQIAPSMWEDMPGELSA